MKNHLLVLFLTPLETAALLLSLTGIVIKLVFLTSISVFTAPARLHRTLEVLDKFKAESKNQ
jgi:hypothetical protein